MLFPSTLCKCHFSLSTEEECAGEWNGSSVAPSADGQALPDTYSAKTFPASPGRSPQGTPPHPQQWSAERQAPERCRGFPGYPFPLPSFSAEGFVGGSDGCCSHPVQPKAAKEKSAKTNRTRALGTR